VAAFDLLIGGRAAAALDAVRRHVASWPRDAMVVNLAANQIGTDLDEEALNHAHEVVIVAAELVGNSERIVGDLTDRGIAINVLCFQVFTQGGQQLLSRA
jgi:glutamate/tyrosine decarboxylase-like PLP-dependent enzyme